MMETVLFGITMTMAIIIAGLVLTVITLAIMCSDWFIKKYTKMATKMTKCAMEAVLESEEESGEA